VTAADDARLDGPIGMTWTKQALLADLAAQGIAYEIIEHPPVMTVEAARSHWAALPGFGAKNLLLKDAGGRLWLVVLPAEAPVDLKALPARIGSKRLSFARPPNWPATRWSGSIQWKTPPRSRCAAGTWCGSCSSTGMIRPSCPPRRDRTGKPLHAGSAPP